MKLRDHADAAILISRLVTSPSGSCAPWTRKTSNSFWNHLRYLEHLWTRELQFDSFRLIENQNSKLIIEMLVTRLLVQVTAAATCHPRAIGHPAGGEPGRTATETISDWQRHLLVIEDNLVFARELNLEPQTQTKLERIQRRLEGWGNLLISPSPHLATFKLGPDRNPELQDSPPVNFDTIWPLLTAGLTRAIPEASVTDAVKSSVHVLLQTEALSLLSRDSFLKDGRIKPRLMRRIENGATIQ